MHKHRARWNAFYVLSGKLRIEAQKNEYALTDVTMLGPDDLTSIQPGEYHRFLTGDEPVEALEIYYPPWVSDEDIVRADHGGRILGS
jgi:mannose-6-phosphate isomerase-like protein (cupin superfamily)